MIGIISYGAYIPKYRIKSEEIAKNNSLDSNFVIKGLLIGEKSVASSDEDSLTMGVEAALNALKKVNINKKQIGAVYCGSESFVYAVKPNASILGEAINIGNNYTAADVEFACKAGAAALQICLGLVKSGFTDYGLAVGSDTAQPIPGDVVEYTASAGAAAFIIGSKKEEIIAELEGMCSFSSDTPDFWRRNMQKFPQHAEHFTGKPAYFKHTINCTKLLMKKLNISANDIDHVAFHTPNGKFPLKVAEILGFPREKVEKNLIVSKIGNSYSAACLLVLTHILDNAKPGERILITSFGSGAGSDSFLFRVTNNIRKLKDNVKTTESYINNKKYVDYAAYCKLVGAIR